LINVNKEIINEKTTTDVTTQQKRHDALFNFFPLITCTLLYFTGPCVSVMRYSAWDGTCFLERFWLWSYIKMLQWNIVTCIILCLSLCILHDGDYFRVFMAISSWNNVWDSWCIYFLLLYDCIEPCIKECLLPHSGYKVLGNYS